MDSLLRQSDVYKPLVQGKFSDPDITMSGKPRASVALKQLNTLWFNTGTLCNLSCVNCYIESTPKNDRLIYISLAEVTRFLDEVATLGLAIEEIGFTGGEPFMNPEFSKILIETLERGFKVLVLTNAMKPMLRKSVASALEGLNDAQRSRLVFRVSFDHFDETYHDNERGPGSFIKAVEGTDWLVKAGFHVTVAGRQLWFENGQTAREGYQALFDQHSWPIDASDPGQLVLFPEMNEQADTAEITTECWQILGKEPDSLMCASSRMVVHRKGEPGAVVLPCTLIAYDQRFIMGKTLEDSLKADGGMFMEGAVKLNHPHCARFCVLGGASCSG